MTNYDVVEGYSLRELIENVNASIERGFIPIGSVFIDENDDYYKQTMFDPNVKIGRYEV